MTFSELTEYAKNGMMTPNFGYQSEQLAYLTLVSILRAYRDGLLTAQQAREQRDRAEKLFERARQEENDRLNVYRAYQDNMRKIEEDVSCVNRMMADESGDHRALVDMLVGIVERLVNVKIRRITE